MISNGNKNFSVQFEPHAVMPKAVFLNFLALMVEAKLKVGDMKGRQSRIA
jgi:hypothetical protein